MTPTMYPKKLFSSFNRIHAAAALLAVVLLAACAAEQKVQATQKPDDAEAAAPQNQPSFSGIAGADPDQSPSRTPTFIMGSGQFVGKAADKPAAQPAGDKAIQLSFVDTDVRAVLTSILGDALGLSYTIDPSIKGTITVQSARPLPKDDLLRALEIALSLQDIALVARGDGAYDVVPMKDAQRRISGVRLPDSAGMPGFGVQVVSLRYTGAEEMNKLLEPFAPAGSIVRVDNSRNLLVLAGTGEELTSLLDIVQTFDVDWLSGMSYAFYPVQYADAKTVADELKQIFDDQKGPMSGVVRLIPLSRLNTVLVASPQPEYLQKVGDWIKRLDLGNSSPGRRIYVYDVQNGKASDLAQTLGQIFGIAEAGSSSSQNSSSSRGSSSIGQNGLSGLQSGSAGISNGGGILQNGQSLGNTGAQSFGQSQYQPYSNGNGNSQPVINGSGAPVSLETAGLRIVPDESTNALLVLATPSEFGVIDTAIKRLDVTPRQVLIEASLAEVTLSDEIKFGVEWAFKSSAHSATFSPNSNGSVSSQFLGFSYLYTGAGNIAAALNALESITKVKVLSSPKLLVLNNHEAEIEVGDEVPILTQQAVSTSQSDAPIVNSVEQRSTGVILHITPRVNQSGMVILDIEQEVSAVVPTTTSDIDSPTIQERQLSTTVAVHDGEIIALGGLITDSKSNDTSGLPWLSKIPVLGWLFGTKDVSHDRTELIAFLRPRVIRDPAELRRVMEDLHTEFGSVENQMGQGLGTPKTP